MRQQNLIKTSAAIVGSRPCSALLAQIASESVIDQAYLWLCQQRKDYPHNADIWGLRYHWNSEKPQLIDQLRSGQYQYSPVQLLKRADGSAIHLWSSRDALVMKAIALILSSRFPLSPRCTHVKGHGGLKGALRWLRSKLPSHRYVFRTDVKGYYESIDQHILLTQIEHYVPEKDVMRLLVPVITRTVEWGGTFREITKGIGRGSPLSPIWAALYLKPLDDAMDRAGIAYVRYMDDWVVLEKQRWRFKKVIGIVNQVLAELKLKKHPDKTTIGTIDRGFDFLGYRHTRAGLVPAADTIRRFQTRLTRLYEQGAPPARIGVYETRWWRWVCGGLPKNQVLVGQNFSKTAVGTVALNS